MKTVILAGGKGSRLVPYTTVFPKPLVPVGDVPIIDLVLRQLRHSGAREVTLAVGHLAELIMAYCGDGSQYDLSITYTREHEPLGTIGPLSLIPDLGEPFLVLNGDVLTDLDYGALQRFHRSSGAVATVACYRRPVPIDKAVVEIDDQQRIVDYREKPTLHQLVAMGLYVFEPDALRLILPGVRMDAPDLIRLLIERGARVQAYIFEGYWLDIGVPSDYHQAISDASEVRRRIFGFDADAPRV